MIRSSRTSYRFANFGKLNDLMIFQKEYRRVFGLFIDKLWEMEKLPQFLPIEVTKSFNTWLSARMLQCIGKQASGVVNGTRKKNNQREWRVRQLEKEGKTEAADRLSKVIEKNRPSKPNLGEVCPELDSRFITIDLNNDTTFDGWVTIQSIGNRMKIVLPFKKTKHINSLLENGNIKAGIRLTPKSFTFMFDVEDVEQKDSGNTIGIDIGQTTLLSCSDGISSSKNSHGHDLSTISDILSRKKKGSKGFRRTQEHRKNYINWSVNQLNLNNTKQINLEKIKDLKRGRVTSRKLSHWTYTLIRDKLESKCQEEGVLISYIDPTYTSQRCSCCGWVQKSNRNGKTFICKSCNHTEDADINASHNIALNLQPIPTGNKRTGANVKGYYWHEFGQEPIVPDVEKTKRNKI